MCITIFLIGSAHFAAATAYAHAPCFAGKNNALLNALKEEIFSLESEKISGALSAEEYAKQKAALETVLARALSRK